MKEGCKKQYHRANPGWSFADWLADRADRRGKVKKDLHRIFTKKARVQEKRRAVQEVSDGIDDYNALDEDYEYMNPEY